METQALPASLHALLTRREEEVLELLAQRLQVKEIAERFFVAPSTVKSHLHSIYSKLKVAGSREAIRKLRRLGAARQEPAR